MERIVKYKSPYLNYRQRLSIIDDKLRSFNYERGEFTGEWDLGDNKIDTVKQAVKESIDAGISQFDIVNPLYVLGTSFYEFFLVVVADELKLAFTKSWPGRIHCVQTLNQILDEDCTEVAELNSRLKYQSMTTGAMWNEGSEYTELDIMQGDPRNNHDISALKAMCLLSYLYLSEDYYIDPEDNILNLGTVFNPDRYKFLFNYGGPVYDIVQPYNYWLFSVNSPYLDSRYCYKSNGLKTLEELMGIPDAEPGVGAKLLEYADRFNPKLLEGLKDYVSKINQQLAQDIRDNTEQQNGYIRLLYKYCRTLLANGCYIAGVDGDEILVASPVHTNTIGKAFDCMQAANEAAGNVFSRPKLWVDAELATAGDVKYTVAMAEAAGPSILNQPKLKTGLTEDKRI